MSVLTFTEGQLPSCHSLCSVAALLGRWVTREHALDPSSITIIIFFEATIDTRTTKLGKDAEEVLF